MAATERIIALRGDIAARIPPSIRSAEGNLHYLRGYLEARYSSCHAVRRAAAKAYMHAHATPVIHPHELIVGKPSYRPLSAQEAAELAQLEAFAAPALPSLGGQDSHMTVDYELLLEQGLDGVAARVKALKAALDCEDPAQCEKNDFYEACLIALDGVTQYAAHYAEHARQLAAACEDAGRARELIEIAETLDRVPRYPAQTYRQALQSMCFLTFCMEGLYQLGRVDRLLIRYYEVDIQSGLLTREAAQELLDCASLLYNDTVPAGLAAGYMVGGRGADGKPVCNDITYMAIEGIAHTRMAYPGVGLCYTGDMPEDILRLSCDILGQGLSHPAIFNDDVIAKGLTGYGVPEAHARSYIHCTCVEITPIAASGTWVASPYINLTAVLLEIGRAHV